MSDMDARLAFNRENSDIQRGMAVTFYDEPQAEIASPEPTNVAEPTVPEPQAKEEVPTITAFDPTKVEWNSRPTMFRPPEDKMNDLTWYAERYSELSQQLSSEEFLDSFVKNLAKERGIEDVEDFITHYKGIKNNPTEYIRTHFPDEAAKAGISPVMDEQTLAMRTHEQMVQEYGEDYQSRFIQSEALNPNSFSAKMLAKQNIIYSELATKNQQAKEAYNARLKELSQPQKPFEPTDEQRKEYFKPALEAGYTWEEALALEKEIANGNWRPTMKDLLTIRNIDSFAKSQYDKGVEDGRKGIRSQEWQAVKSSEKVVAQTESKQNTSPFGGTFLSNYF